MRENIYTFGENRSLVGIITEPGTETSSGEGIGVIFLNAGVLHHVGPNRMWVDMARLFSEHGFISFRFDLAGFGDSLSTLTQKSYEERSVSDVQDAMDILSNRKGIRKFILIGFCSGAENAHRVALEDERIVGVVFMDGYAYRTFKFYIKRYGLILLNPLKITKFILRNIISLPGRFIKRTKEKDERGQIFASDLPPKCEYLRDLEKLIDKNVSMLFTFSHGSYKYYNYQNQFLDAFNTLNHKYLITSCYYGYADHMYTELETRKILISDILSWLDKTRSRAGSSIYKLSL